MAAAARLPHLLLAVAAAAFASTTVFGFAASLGAGTSGLGAGSQVVASCGSGMSFDYTAGFDTATSGFVVRSIELTKIPAGCRSKSVSVIFSDSESNPVGAPVVATLPVADTTHGISIVPGPETIAVSQIAGVSVVVS